MNQFLIENPAVCIVIAFIIGAVIMNITSALTVRMAVDKEVAKALGEEEETRETWERQRQDLIKEIMENLAPQASPEQKRVIIEKAEILTVMLGVDGDGCRCIYLAPPKLYKQGEGPLAGIGHDYYYHPTLQFLADDFDLDKLAELGIDIRPEVEYKPMAVKSFRLENDKVMKFLKEAFNACGKAIEKNSLPF